jgi:hypothetical protein
MNELNYEDKPDYDFLRSLFTSSIQRLGYQDDDPYDWEKSIEQDETDSLSKAEQQKLSSQVDPAKAKPENSLNIKRNLSRSPTPNPIERSKHIFINLGYILIDPGSQSKYHKNNRQLIKSSSRTRLLRKPTNSNDRLPLQQSRFVSPYGFDRIKLDSTGTGDQQPVVHKKVWSQPEGRSPDTLTRRSTHLNTIDRGQATSNGLFTYISQQFSNAAAPGTPSLFSQWSPHNGETFTDDDILKGNKSNSSKADERATTLSGERTSPINTRLNHRNLSIKNNSSGQSSYVSTNRKSGHISDEDNHQEYYLPPKHQHSIEQNIPVPFGTYVRNTRTNNNSNRRSNSKKKI